MWIATGGATDDKAIQRALMSSQKFFDHIHAAVDKKQSLTNGEISEIKSYHSDLVGFIYDQNPTEIPVIFVNCQRWMNSNFEGYVEAINTARGNFDSFSRELNLTFKPYSKRNSISVEEINLARRLTDAGFTFWDTQNRKTPFKFKKELKQQLR